MKTDVCKIMIADSHLLMLDAIQKYISNIDLCKVIGTAKNGSELLKLITPSNVPDVVILDINLPVMDGYETASLLKERYPDTKVIIFTMFDIDGIVLRFLRIGVKVFVKKNVDPGDLRKVVEGVINEGYCYPDSITGKLANLFQKTKKGGFPLDKIIPNELEIKFLKLVTSEYTYREIASIMAIPPRTVDTLRDSLFYKLDVKSRVGLAMYAVKNGLVEI